MDIEEGLRCRAKDDLESLIRHARCFDSKREEEIARFSSTECIQGPELGTGGFCTVYEVKDLQLIPERRKAQRRGSSTLLLPLRKQSLDDSASKVKSRNNGASLSPNDDPIEFVSMKSRQFIATTVMRNGHARYAMKKLSRKTSKKAASHRPYDREMFVAGVVDLAMEAKFLASLQHPHIIKVRGVSSADSCSDLYFIVLDRLYETLSDRIHVWRKTKKDLSGIRSFVDGKKDLKILKLYNERLCVGYSICSAMMYLHSRRIVYRDLKPDNIGFDVRDVVKVFDFGLAREMAPGEDKSDELFVMSGDTGSLRYMAPENALKQPYNHKVDVYSFGLILWQIMRLETPFKSIEGIEGFRHRVIKGGERPLLGEGTKQLPWSSEIKKLIRRCWSTTITDRPEFHEIHLALQEEIKKIEPEVLDSLDDTNRTYDSYNKAVETKKSETPRSQSLRCF